MGRSFGHVGSVCSTAVEQRRPDAEKLFTRLRDDALLANPLLDFDRLLILKRRRGQLGLPTNHQCNTCLKQDKYDNELAILSPVRPTGTLSTLFRPDRRLVRRRNGPAPRG